MSTIGSMKKPKRAGQTLPISPPLGASDAGVWHSLPVYVTAALVLLAACALLVTWASPEPGVGDLFVSLAGGRDVMDGKLCHGDDWSFATGGRVWINQNWLSHLLIFLTWRVAGPTGLLVLKAILLAAMASFLCLLSRQRGCPWPVAILLSAGLTMSCHLFIDLRANLLTLVMLPLLMWVLYQTLDRRQRIWWAIPILLAWANLHGGFVFGLGMVGLCAVCICLADWYRDGRTSLPRNWPVWACVVLCIAAVTVSPFGLGNLTHPLVIATSHAWRGVNEWRPLLESPLPMPWAFLVVLGLAAALAVVRVLAFVLSRQHLRHGAGPAAVAIGPWLFTGVLSVVAVILAFDSWRFVPVAILALAAPLASSLAWLTARLGRKVLAGAFACVLVGVLFLVRQDLMAYWPSSPIQRGATIFDRMHDLPEGFPVQAAQFLADNHVSDNVFSEWAWEGYLRWICPGAKVFIGGRAQQIYTEKILADYHRLDDPQQTVLLLQQYQAHLTVLSAKDLGYARMSGLLNSGKWACIYSDGAVMVLADTQADNQLVQRTLAGQLKYPTEAIRTLSRALCLATIRPAGDPTEILATSKAACAIRPARQAYFMIGSIGRTPSLRPCIIQYLEEESSRLLRMPGTPDDCMAVLQCRGAIQAALAGLYRDAEQPVAARAAQAQAEALLRQMRSLVASWEYMPAPWQGKSQNNE